MQVSIDGAGVYVGGERGGLIYVRQGERDGSLGATKTWEASEFDAAMKVCDGRKRGTPEARHALDAHILH